MKRLPRTSFNRRTWTLCLLALCLLLPGWSSIPAVDVAGQTLSFAVIGDSGSGKPQQYAVARAMEKARARQPFSLVLMLGDNIYGDFMGASSFVDKFQKPYAGLLAAGVKFHAVLGNHGSAADETHYEPFGMGGRRYYNFKSGDGLAEFFALDADTLDALPVDAAQVEWLANALKASTARWKIAFFHNPIYNAGLQHGPNLRLRSVVEPLFLRHGVRLVLSGHEHIYERLKPQSGILYFVSGGASKFRPNDVDHSNPTLAVANDAVCHFILFVLTPDELRFQAISPDGEVFDSGTFPLSGKQK
jgi:hypothetical protein